MNSSDRVLSQRYSRALCEAAKAAGKLDAVQADLKKSFGPLRSKMKFFLHPLVGAAEKGREIDTVLGKNAAYVTGRFLKLLIEKKRFNLLPSIAVDFEKIVEEENGVLRAVVRSASPLDEKDMQALASRLGKATGKKVTVEAKEDKSLIGGLVVKLGDWVLDASFRRHLSRMRDGILGN